MNNPQNTSRWKKRLVVSAAVAVGFLLLFPLTDRDYSVSLVVSLVPVAWGLYALLTYSDPKERIVGWVALSLSFFIAGLVFNNNLTFAFEWQEEMAMDAMPLIMPAIVCVIAYWIVIRSVPHLPKPWGKRIAIGYTALQLGGWAVMHLLVSVPFAADVRTMHQQAQANIPNEIARYKSWEPNPDPQYIQGIQKNVNKAPWCSVWSVSPIPFVLVTTENYQIGPLWGLGMLRVYVWKLTSMKCVLEGRAWIS